MGTITNDGLDTQAALLIEAFPYIANGTGSTAEAETDTALESENALYGAARKAATTSTSSNGISTWYALFAITGGNVSVREYGIFSASSGGTMLYRRVLLAARNYTDGDALELNITHTHARSA
ncbi:MAG: hypothetical protein ABFD07_16345 [Methanobacterium sp.]